MLISTDFLRRWLAATVLVVAAALGVLLIAASHAQAAGHGTLTLVMTTEPQSLNPVDQNVDPADDWLIELAYAPIIEVNGQGKAEPGLAASWGYVGKGNRVFVIHVRKGVKFADGQPLTAAAMAASIRYYLTGTDGKQWAGSITSVTATGRYTVTIHSTPNPNLPLIFDQNTLGGAVIAPNGLANKSQLGTQSYGAGPYVLDPSQTTANSQYTFVRNPHYWDPKAQYWNKVVVRVILNPDSALEAVETGQAQFMFGAANQASAAQAGGLKVYQSPAAFAGVNLIDRGGQVVKPLASLQVREALNYAINRPAITSAVYGAYAQPSDEAGITGYPDTYDPQSATTYTYNPAKAKQLLAQAGYPNGFSLGTLPEAGGFQSVGTLTTAVLSQWATIGVTATEKTDNGPAPYFADITSKQYGAFGYAYGGLPMFLEAVNWFEPNANDWNPFVSDDPIMTKLLSQAATAPAAKSLTLYQKVEREAIKQAWFVNVSQVDDVYFGAKSISGVSVSPHNYSADATELRPAS